MEGDVFPGDTLRAEELQSQAGLSGVLGGFRSSSLVASTLGPTQVTVRAGANPFNGGIGNLSISTGTATQGIFNLTYEGSAGLSQDFSGLGSGVFAIDLISGDLDLPGTENDRPVPITLALTSGLGTADEFTASVTNFLVEAGTYEFEFADFAGVAFGDVDRISLTIDQSAPTLASVDFSFGGAFRAVPSPSGAALLGIAGLAATRRRR